MLRAQKAKKQIQTPPASCAAAGHMILSMEKMACPPIQHWMPNQPQATRARITAGTFAPRTPNEARTNTGKGMPYFFAPACALRSMGTRTIRFPNRIVPTACHQLIPARDETAGEHVGGDADGHGNPERGVVVDAPGALGLGDGREVFVVQSGIVHD